MIKVELQGLKFPAIEIPRIRKRNYLSLIQAILLMTLYINLE